MGGQKPRLSDPERLRQLEITAAIDRYLDRRHAHYSEDYRQALKSSIARNVAIAEGAIEQPAIHLERASGSTPVRLQALRRCLKAQKTAKGLPHQWLCGRFSEREKRAVAEIAALPDAGELQNELYNVIGDYSAYVWGATALLTYAGLQLWRRTKGASTGDGTPSEYRKSIRDSNARITAITDKARADQAKQREDLIAAREATQKANEEAAAKYGENEALRRQAVEDARIQAALDRDRKVREHKDRNAINFWGNPVKGVSTLAYAAQQLPAPIILALAAGVGLHIIGDPKGLSQAVQAVKTVNEAQAIAEDQLNKLVAQPVPSLAQGHVDAMNSFWDAANGYLAGLKQ